MPRASIGLGLAFSFICSAAPVAAQAKKFVHSIDDLPQFGEGPAKAQDAAAAGGTGKIVLKP